jgi:protein-disulfide isomerase
MSRAFLSRPRGARALLLALLSWLLCACASSAAPAGSPAAPTSAQTASASEPVEGVEGIDISDLTDDEQALWLDLINSELSPCGEPISVGRCAAMTDGCARCAGGAHYLKRLIIEGYGGDAVTERYRARYAAEGAVTLELDGRPVRGPADAAVTLVVFSDFECPHCGRAHPVLSELLRKHPAQLRMVFKHFPLPGHPHALDAARAAVAAQAQDKFWPMHDMLFDNQRALAEEQLREYAQTVGLDVERFDADRNAPETLAVVEADVEEGVKLGVQGTPTIFINGRRFQDPFATLADYIEEEIAR